MRAKVADLRAEPHALHTRILLGGDSYTDEQKELMGSVVWPVVDTQPGSGRKVLFVGVHARQIVGMTTDESRLLLSDLLEHATQRERVYVHKWQIGDLVMWDNVPRCTAGVASISTDAANCAAPWRMTRRKRCSLSLRVISLGEIVVGNRRQAG